jgi:hypothetical protein
MINRGSGPGRTTDPAPGGSQLDRRRWVTIQPASTPAFQEQRVLVGRLCGRPSRVVCADAHGDRVVVRSCRNLGLRRAMRAQPGPGQREDSAVPSKQEVEQPLERGSTSPGGWQARRPMAASAVMVGPGIACSGSHFDIDLARRRARSGLILGDPSSALACPRAEGHKDRPRFALATEKQFTGPGDICATGDPPEGIDCAPLGLLSSVGDGLPMLRADPRELIAGSNYVSNGKRPGRQQELLARTRDEVSPIDSVAR